MNESEKFELELVTTEELCELARKHKKDIEALKRDIKLFGMEDDDYPLWKRELWDKTRRYNYIVRRIQSRQLKMF